MKKVLVCALAVFFLMASCSTAFAANINTVTAYNSDVEGEFTVTTYVTDAAEGDKVTYLAYKNAKATDSVVYVDQTTIGSAGTATFNFSATPADIAITEVQLGTTSTTAVNNGEADNLANNVRNVTITVDNGEGVPAVFPDYSEGALLYVSDLTIGANQIVDVATIDNTKVGVAYSGDSVVLLDSAAIVEDAIINITTRDSVDSVSIDEGSIQTACFASTDGDTLTVFAKVQVNNEEFGIKVAKNAEMTGAVKYPAYAIGDKGQFAVQLINETGELDFTADDVTYYAQVYVGEEVSKAVVVTRK